MKKLNLNSRSKSYSIYIGNQIALDKKIMKHYIVSSKILIVSNETIAALYLDSLTNALNDFDLKTCILPDGESNKTLDTLTLIYDTLIEHCCHRDTTLIALGGGVIGDMTGFAAATYQRGCHFIQIPTTLLAQTDASIGGKTAVNYHDKKNMIGCFYQPECVINDIHFLKTLPEREFISGLAEVIKHAAIRNAVFFKWLEAHRENILKRDEKILIDMLTQSVQIKIDIVEQDETEQAGLRALLNFGHTFAHAIEAATHYQTYLHGEAVAIGMCMAAQLSCQENLFSTQDANRLITLIESMGLPTKLKIEIEDEKLNALMRHDKKNRAGEQRFVLLKAIGSAVIKNIS